MKKVKRRTFATLILAVLLLLGVGVYIVKYATEGQKWVSSTVDSAVFSNGVLTKGTVTDRNGVVLSTIKNGERVYADSADVRTATLHAVGDSSGNIGTGALSAFGSKLIGYNIFNGTYTPNGKGATVKLSIDSSLNVTAYKALAGRKGTVGIVNYKTGEILCMVSAPSYDPADPPEIKEGSTKYEGVYMNRFLSATYTPGSIFKLITVAAAIENISDLYSRTFTCTGSITIGGGKITCPEVHGKMSIEDALADSCNVTFGKLAVELGADTLAKYADKCGLTSSTAISGLATAKGNFEKGEDGSADLAWSGIGQYNDEICPAVMLRYVGAIANDGVAINMNLIKKSGLSSFLPTGSDRILSKDTADKIQDMMSYDVHHTYGTDNFPGLDLYAKSGTAEVGNGKSPHAWFTGFIKDDNHPYAFIVLVENGGWGSSTAGSIANKVLQQAVGK